MAVLMAPVLSWMQSGMGEGRPFQSSAQVIGGCTSTSNTIIKQLCLNGVAYGPDLAQLEADAVSAYIAEHALSSSDSPVIYSYGRSDLRDAVRAQMIAILHGIITTPPNQRTPHQQNLFNWFSSLVQANEISLYQNAVSEFNRWQANPCQFTLDPVVASTYGLSYDGLAFCGASLTSLLGGLPVPAENYFTAFGLRKSYGKAADTYPYFATLAEKTSVNLGVVAGIASAAGGLVIAGAGALAASANAALALYDAAQISSDIYDVGLAMEDAAFVISGETVDVVGLAGVVAAPVAIVLVAIAIGVEAGMQAFNSEQTINDLKNLQNTLTQVTNTPPDLVSMAADTTGQGMYKLQTSVEAQTLPETASSATLPTHSALTDANFSIQIGSAAPQITSTLGYKDWDGNTWSAQTWGGWFVQKCTAAPGGTCVQSDSISGSLEYVDWNGVKWTADRMGNLFTSTKAKPASTDVKCAADQTGVSPGTDFSKCKSYVSSSIPLVDSNGNLARVSMSSLIPPTFTSSPTLSFAPNYPSMQTITAVGTPAPTCSLVGNLPTESFTLSGDCANTPLVLKFNGTAPNATQIYSLSLKATNSLGSVTQNFSVQVSPALGIISPGTAGGQFGVPFHFTVVATGVPPLSLSLDSSLHLPQGLTFTDNHDGTATISGTPTAAGLAACASIVTDGSPQPPCGIIVQGSQGQYEQNFSLTVPPPPTPTLLPPTTTTFVAGIPNEFLLSSAGALTQVSWVFGPDQNAPWLTLTDNGDGTATLKGTPPAGTAGTFTPSVEPIAVGQELFQAQGLTINVVNGPVFTSPNSANFTVGTFGSFPVTASQGSVSSPSQMPKGLLLNSGNPASISGVAAAGTGGEYTVQLSDNAGTAGSAAQSLSLNVFEAPSFTSPNAATFLVGKASSFAVTTAGFPSVSTHSVGTNPLPPTSPTQGNGMYFTVIGLPADLQMANLNPQGFATGTLMIQGTPSAADAGMHQVMITAQNGVGLAAQQTLALNIVSITGAAPASGTTCNGSYNGTFKGNLTVGVGQNCSFVPGSVINGNVAVNGGSLSLDGTTVTGNIGIQGGAAFSITDGTTVSGNLSIQSVAAGATGNRVCGSKIAGNLSVSSNAAPVTVGAPDISCPGSSFANNVTLQDNTALVKIYDNQVQKNLACTNNLSITGGGNQAQAKNGQCSGF